MKKHSEVLSRTGWKQVYELLPEDSWRIFEGKIIIVNPNHPPKVIHEDGTIEEIKVIQ